MFKHYAQINEQGRVIAVSQLAGVVEAPNLIEIAEGQNVIGKIYQNGEFTDAPAPAPAPIRNITKGAFYGRFTLAEAVALESSADPVIAVFKKRLDYRTHVDLDFPETVEGLDYLEQSPEFPDFDQTRKAAMLQDGTEAERYKGL